MNDAGEWFILDSGNARVRKVDLNGIITSVAGGGNDEQGEGPATDVKMMMPNCFTFTPSGELLVSVFGYDIIREMDKKGFMRVIAGGGSTKPSSDQPILAKTALVKSTGIASARDGSGDIFVSVSNGAIYKLYFLECFGVKANNAAVCSGHGNCIATDQCQCDSGWMKVDCSLTHCFGFSSNLPDKVCSGRGTCVRQNKCHCSDGYRGHKCHKPPKEIIY